VFASKQRLLSLWKLGYKLASELAWLWCCSLLFHIMYHLRYPITRSLLFQIHLWSPTPLRFTAHGPCSTLLSLLLLTLNLCIWLETCTNCSFSKIITLDWCWQTFQRKGKSIDLKYRSSSCRLQSLAQNIGGYSFSTARLQITANMMFLSLDLFSAYFQLKLENEK